MSSIRALRQRLTPVLMLLLAACSSAPVQDSNAAAPPGPPATMQARGDVGVIKNRYGMLGRTYWLFEPSVAPQGGAPVIIFMHGFGGNWPGPYNGWIYHLVQRGYIVIYPAYQATTMTLTALYVPNTLSSLNAAFSELQSGKHVRPDLSRIAIVGHSMGGSIAANLAAMSGEPGSGVPKFRAMMNVAPQNGGDLIFPLGDYSHIPSDLLMLEVVGDVDKIAGDRVAKLIYYGATRVPLANKRFVTLHSDSHGLPGLVADHFAPLSQDEGSGGQIQYKTDALDWYGYWKLFDALTDAAFYGRNRALALGGGADEADMGRWSDGTPVVPMTVTDRP